MPAERSSLSEQFAQAENPIALSVHLMYLVANSDLQPSTKLFLYDRVTDHLLENTTEPKGKLENLGEGIMDSAIPDSQAEIILGLLIKRQDLPVEPKEQETKLSQKSDRQADKERLRAKQEIRQKGKRQLTLYDAMRYAGTTAEKRKSRHNSRFNSDRQQKQEIRS
jgi:hypothetical protein